MSGFLHIKDMPYISVDGRAEGQDFGKIGGWRMHLYSKPPFSVIFILIRISLLLLLLTLVGGVCAF